ncbi:MAG: hypothetical protein HYU52_01155 [Acidobacteria bacterium]|nr:hypothetical protein [Acidobacteriota bacterium]
MTALAWTLTVAILICFAAVAARYAYRFAELHGKRVLTCPETGEAVGVDLDARRAASTSLFGNRPALRLTDCTRWPERAGCNQACLHQLEAAPESCKLQTILADWYRGKKCVFCRKPFDAINWTDHRPALLAPDLRTIEWTDVRPEMVDLVLSTHGAVCWNCHIAESFRHEHPELVTDRRFAKEEPPTHH